MMTFSLESFEFGATFASHSTTVIMLLYHVPVMILLRKKFAIKIPILIDFRKRIKVIVFFVLK
jgi:hypothetical protein